MYQAGCFIFPRVTNRVTFLTVLMGNISSPTIRDKTSFIIKYNTQPMIGRNRKTAGVIRVSVFQPGTMPEKT